MRAEQTALVARKTTIIKDVFLALLVGALLGLLFAFFKLL